MTRRRKAVAGIATAILAIMLLIQLVPYGRTHSNPPTTGQPSWDSAETERLVRRACFDCHSHETRWPWYASIAPVSWRVQSHVNEGRAKLNFSAFDRPQEEAHEAADAVRNGEMPLWDYALMHPESRLSAEDRQRLVRGLRATFGGDGDGDGGEDEGEDARRDGHR